MKYKATIVVTMHNDEQYVEACINSIICGITNEYQLILIDDASTDDTVAICDKYIVSNIKLIQLPQNSGLSVARQVGLDNALGKYISFVDADDLISENYLSSFIREMENNMLDVCVCRTKFVNGDDVSSLLPWDEKNSAAIKITKERVDYDYINLTSIYHLSDSWDKMYRRTFLLDSGLTFCMPKGLNGSDSMFNRMMILQLPKIKMISEALYIHITRQNSMVTRKDKDLLKMNIVMYSKLLAKANELKYKNVYEAFRIEFFYRVRSELLQKYAVTSKMEYSIILINRIERIVAYIEDHPELNKPIYSLKHIDLCVFKILIKNKLFNTWYIRVFSTLKRYRRKIQVKFR